MRPSNSSSSPYDSNNITSANNNSNIPNNGLSQLYAEVGLPLTPPAPLSNAQLEMQYECPSMFTHTHAPHTPTHIHTTATPSNEFSSGYACVVYVHMWRREYQTHYCKQLRMSITNTYSCVFMSIMCTGCLEEYHVGEMCGLACRHFYCTDCFSQYLKIQIEEGTHRLHKQRQTQIHARLYIYMYILTDACSFCAWYACTLCCLQLSQFPGTPADGLTCPAHKCKYLVDQVTLASLIDVEMYRYSTHLPTTAHAGMIGES